MDSAISHLSPVFAICFPSQKQRMNNTWSLKNPKCHHGTDAWNKNLKHLLGLSRLQQWAGGSDSPSEVSRLGVEVSLRTGHLVTLSISCPWSATSPLVYFGRFVLVPSQNQEVQKHMKTNNTLKRFSQIIQSSRKQEIIQQYWDIVFYLINYISSH